MKARHIIKNLLLLLFLGTVFTHCTTSKHIGKDQYLLSKNKITLNGKTIKHKNLLPLLKQKPNKRFLGIAPLDLVLYNLASKDAEKSFLKKIGEAPIILNYRLARKSASQIELHYKNKGFFDTSVHYEVETKKHKAKLKYIINTGDVYKIHKVNLNSQADTNISKIITNLLPQSNLKKNKPYNVQVIESERVAIAHQLQNSGYYRFNKEFIYFLADTNQRNKKIDLTLIVKNPEKSVDGTLLQETHRLGIIGSVNVHLETKDNSSQKDTITQSGIHFIYQKGTPPFNLNRLVEKIIIRSGLPYNKTIVDKSYQALSELNNFKKISFEFTPIASDKEKDVLKAEVFLVQGKKIAYSIDAEATTNPILKEGISGSASLSHYNIFKGAEHLQLTYKGSNNFNNIKENGFIMNLTIPSLISPFKLNRVLNKNSRTKTVFRTSVSEQKRPEFTRNSITGSYTYQWKRKQRFQHKLSLFNLSYVNFQGDSADLSNISEFLIAKDYSSHLIPTSSYTISYNNQDLNKLKNHIYFRFHIESSGTILKTLAEPLKFNKLRDDEGNLILQDDGSSSYTLNLWNQENIFTQYIKTSFDYRYYWEIDKKNSVVFRSFAGVIYAYGNTSQAPFHKKFTAGGANDLRGWQAYKRPTGMLTTTDTLYTGGLKLISSLEYRFNIIKSLKGALFMDAGNIWEISANNSIHEAANFHIKNFTNEIAVDVGLGLRYDFQYFILRSDLGFPVREPNEGPMWQWDKVSFKDSQLNIGLSYPF